MVAQFAHLNCMPAVCLCPAAAAESVAGPNIGDMVQESADASDRHCVLACLWALHWDLY